MKTIPLQYLSAIPITNGLGLPGSHNNPEWPRYIRTTDIAGPLTLRDDTFASQPPDVAASAIVEPGDILMSAAGTIGKSVTFRGSHAACYAGFLARVRPIDAATGRFLGYWMQSQHYWDQVNAGAVRSTIDNFSAGKYRKLAVPHLPPASMTAIADYLDRETAQIDALIAKQEQLIATLRERRVAVIADTVLKGFDPLRHESSVTATTVGTHFSVVLGKMLDAGKQPKQDDVPLPYLRAANVQDFGLALETVNTMHYTADEADRLDLRARDLLVVEGGAIGTCAVLTEDMPGWSFQKTLNRVRSLGSASTSWLSYVLRAYRDSGVIATICDGSTIAHFTAEKLRALRIPRISREEQRTLAADLDTQTAKIDTLIAKAEQFIALAKERRAALITAAVTGQIDVREAA